MGDATFFFQQTPFKKKEKRLKKYPDDLPQELRLAHLNRRVTDYLIHKEKEARQEEKEKEQQQQQQQQQQLQQQHHQQQQFNDGRRKKSLLPQISQTLIVLKTKLDGYLDDTDKERVVFTEAKLRGESVIIQLDKLIDRFKGSKICLPKVVKQELGAQFKDLTAGVRIKKREWQNPANKALYHARKKTKAKQRQQLEQAKKLQLEQAKKLQLEQAKKLPLEQAKKLPLEQAKKLPLSALTVATMASDRGASVLGDDDGRVSATTDGKSSRGNRRQSCVSKLLRGDIPEVKLQLVSQPESKDKSLETHKSSARIEKLSSVPTNTKQITSNLTYPSVGGDVNRLEPVAAGTQPRGNSIKRRNTGGSDDAPETNTFTVSGSWAVIPFQLSNKVFSDLGWLASAGDVHAKKDRNTVLEWALYKLHEMFLRKRQEMKGAYEAGDDYPIVLRFYGEVRKEMMGLYERNQLMPGGMSDEYSNRSGPVWKGEMPRIPAMEGKYKGKVCFQATTPDGSSTVFYPSGRVAIVTSRSLEPGRSSCKAFYTIVYADAPDGRMLAVFTPSGAGCTYHPKNGRINFLCNDDGGTLADEDGNITRRFTWPKIPGQKMRSTVVVPVMRTPAFQLHFGDKLNPSITLRCNNHHHIYLFYACGRETAKYNVGVGLGPNKAKVPSKDELGKLQSGYSFSSRTASDFSVPSSKPGNPVKGKPMKAMKAGAKGKEQKYYRPVEGKMTGMEDVQKILEYPERIQNNKDVADKCLYKLQTKVRETLEKWMEHYRIAMGLPSPLVEALKGLPIMQPRQIKSAMPGGGHTVISPTATSVPKHTSKVRAPSAPPGEQRYNRRPVSAMATGVLRMSAAPPVEGDDESMDIFRTRAQSAVDPRTTHMSDYPGGGNNTTGSDWNPILNLCPLALRTAMLGEKLPKCCCTNYKVPPLADIEFDEFMHRLSSLKQLIVIIVKSSLFPESTQESEDMLQCMYAELNRTRGKPCLQSRTDHMRIFTYDMTSAAQMSDHAQPLLLRRHNVCPGMILIYEHGHLLFCDHIFNGYGNARKDMQKQLMLSQRVANDGHYLPRDFKFSPQKGRPGPRAAWGGEIGGAGVDHHGKTGTGLSTHHFSLTSLSSGDSKDNDQNNASTTAGTSGVNSSTKYISVRLSSGKYPQVTRSTLEATLRKRREDKERLDQQHDYLDSFGEPIGDHQRLRRLHMHSKAVAARHMVHRSSVGSKLNVNIKRDSTMKKDSYKQLNELDVKRESSSRKESYKQLSDLDEDSSGCGN